MVKPIILATNDNSLTKSRFTLRRVWNGTNANNAKRQIGGFRSALNAGDPLLRMNYSCGGPNQLNNLNIRQNLSLMRAGVKNDCDDSDIPASSCNVKYVYDSSDFSRYLKERALQKNYNEVSYGGSNRGDYVFRNRHY